MKTNLPISYICVGFLYQVQACSLVGASVSVNPQGSRLVDAVSFLVELLSLLGPSNLSPTLLQDSLSST